VVCPQISTTSLTSPPSLQQDYHFQTADGHTESISQSPNAWNCRQSASEVIGGNDIMWQKCVFTRPGQATRGNIHKINTPIQQQEINRIFLNSFNKITHQMCTFKAGMLERSVVGPQIPLGKQMYVCMCVAAWYVTCKYGLHSDDSWHITKSEVLRVASLKSQVFWDVTHQLINLHTYRGVAGPLRFRGQAVDAKWTASP
jgi:hypothetical protein